MTSLSQQLKVIAQKSIGVRAPLAFKPSYLFSQKEASDYDNEYILSIALEGLVDLCKWDPRFEEFKSSLFHSTSLSFDRASVSQNANENVKKQIKKFLALLSPHLLAKPSGKALEWLIRRYSVQFEELDEFMMCALPYHETTAFVKFCGLIRPDKYSIWMFCKAVFKSGHPLRMDDLVQNCIRNPGLLSAIHNLMSVASANNATYKTLFSFYASLMTKYVASHPNLDDSLVVSVMAAILSGLQAKNFPDWQISCYMILTQLTSRYNLSSQAMITCLEEIAGFCSESNQSHALLCLVYLCQRSNHLQMLPEDVVRKVLSFKNFETLITSYGEKFNVKRFLELLCYRLCSMTKSLDDLIEIFSLQVIHDSLVEEVAKIMLKKYSDSNSENEKKELKVFLDRFINMFPGSVGIAVDSFLEVSVKKETDTLANISSALKGTMYEPLPETGFSLMASLNHQDEEKQIAGIQSISRFFDTTTEIPINVLDAIRSSLLCIVSNNSPSSLAAILTMEHFPSIFRKKALEVLKCIMAAEEVSLTAKYIGLTSLSGKLVERYPDFQEAISEMSLPLFFFQKKQAKYLQRLVSLKCIEQVAPCCEVIEANAMTKVTSENFPTIYKSLLKNYTEHHDKKYLSMKQISVLEKGDTNSKISAMLILNKILLGEETKISDVEAYSKLLCETISGLSAPLDIPENVAIKKGLPNSALVTLLVEFREKLPVDLILSLVSLMALFKNLITKPCNWIFANNSKMHEETKATMILVEEIFTTLLSIHTTDSLQKFLSNTLEVMDSNAIPFLFFISSTCKTASVQCRTLTLLTQKLNEEKLSINIHSVVPLLLISMSSRDENVKKQAFESCSLLEKQAKKVLSKNLKDSPGSILEKGDLKPMSDKCMSFFLENLKNAELRVSENPSFSLLKFLTKENGDALSQEKRDILAFLYSYIVEIHDKRIQQEMCKVFFDAKCYLKQDDVITVLDRVYQHLKASSRFDNYVNLYNLLAKSFSSTCAKSFNQRKLEKLVNFMETIIFISKNGKYPASSAQNMLKLITPEFYSGLDVERQLVVFQKLITVRVSSKSENVSCIKSILRSLPVKEEIIISEISGVKHILIASDKIDPKKLKSDAHKEDFSNHYSCLVAIMEILEAVQTIKKPHLFVSALFDVLKIVNSSENQLPSIEYIKQLLLSSLAKCVALLKNSEVADDLINVDAVIQCIRVSDNPQTHNDAILLMSTIAEISTEQLIHNVMPLFTFMGANILRKDDNYSFHVIEQAIGKIIPPLMAKAEATGDAKEAFSICKMFVDSLVHIPPHRRVRIFNSLVNVLGVENFLWVILFFLVEVELVSNEDDSISEFCRFLVSRFKPSEQIKTFVNLARNTMLITTSDAMETDKSSSSHESVNFSRVFSPEKYTQQEHFRHTVGCLQLIYDTLISKRFLSRIVTMADNNDNYEDEIEKPSLELLESMVVFITKISESNLSKDFIDVGYGLALDCLEKVNSLLSLSTFTSAISNLLRNPDKAVCRKALSLLEARVNELREAQVTKDEMFIEALSPLLEDLQNIVLSGSSGDKESEITAQTAMLCLSTMAVTFAKNFPDPFKNCLEALLGEGGLECKNPNIVISALVCFSSLCSEMKARIIPFIPKFMPLLVLLTKNAFTGNKLLESNVQETFRVTLLATLDTVAETLPLFLSPYLSGLLSSLVTPSLNPNIEMKVKHFLFLVAEKVPLRTLLPPVTEYFSTAKQSGSKCLLLYFDFISAIFKFSTRESIISQAKSLFKFYLDSFDYRKTSGKKFSLEVEICIIESFLSMVVKLNENMFKPMFLKLISWADLSAQGQPERLSFFYHFMDRLLTKLKAIVCPYFSHIFDVSLGLLKQSDAAQYETWKLLVSCFQKLFIYDKNGFISSDRFKAIVRPMIDQLEMITVNADFYNERMELLIPTLGHLAVSTKDDKLWKILNHEVLMKSRNSNFQVRLSALNALECFYDRLCEEFLIFFPETIPFLAELLEDENPEVEKKTHQVVSVIEKYLGEPISNYLEQ